MNSVTAGGAAPHEELPPSIRVFVVDDQQLVQEGLRELLAAEVDIDVVGQSDAAEAVLEACEALRPNVLLIDLTLPEMRALPLIRDVRRRCPTIGAIALAECAVSRCRVLHQEAPLATHCAVLAADPGARETCLELALMAGAHGSLRKTCSRSELSRALRAVARGERWMAPTTALRLIDHLQQPRDAAPAPPLAEGLTQRELEAIRELVLGHSNKEIGRALGIREQTVKNMISRVLAKLDLADRVQLVLYAVNTHLLERHTSRLP